MSFLKPINKKIQKRLFQKMRILGREGNSPNATVNVDGLSLDKMATRSTFIRMTSGLREPIVLMGGELVETADENFNIQRDTAQGYDEIYGPRPYLTYDLQIKGENKFRRPMPGIKSLDAQFLGGNKALRQATINWTCWSFEDIDRLTPHFLSVGKTVCVEWGWVYGNNGLRNVRGFIGPNGIRKSAYENYREVVNGMKGDIDMMVGIVKNFEFNTRSDGGFDCTTTLTSVGSDMLKKPAPAKGATNMTVRLNAKKGETAKELKEKIESDNVEKNEVEITLKNMISEIDEFLLDQISTFNTKGAADGGYVKGTSELNYSGTGRYRYVRNSFLIDGNKSAGKPNDVWVRWGWFEDNILSKFETIIGGSIIKSEIRSVDNVLDKITDKVIGYTPTLIRDDENLETTNPFKFILPGKFFPLDKNAISEAYKKAVGVELSGTYGDKTKLVELATVVNEDDNFQPFNAAEVKGIDIGRPDRGVFRNILINTKLLKEAMGVLEGPGVESFSTFEFLSRMFDLLNEDIGFWNYQIQADENQTYRLKIVDTFAVDKPILEADPSKPALGDSTTRSVYDPSLNEVVNNGIFYFPVWQHDSLVKDQNVSCTIPNQLAISIMYGANAPKIKTGGATENEANDEESQAAAGIGKAANDDGDLKDLQIALHKDGYENYGLDSTPLSAPSANTIGPRQDFDTYPEYKTGLSRKGYKLNVSIKDFFNTTSVKERTADRKKEKQKKKDEKINASVDAKLQSDLDAQISAAIPTPLFNRLTPEQRIQVFKNVEFNGVKVDDKVLNLKPQSNFAELYFTKFDADGRMKQNFIDSIVYNVTYNTKTKSTKKVKQSSTELEKPLLLPISLELSIDGIGGIFPFESFHSTYLPKRYQKEALFQIFSVNHTVDSTQWTTTIGGKMRSNLKTIYKTEIVENQVKEVLDQLHAAQAASFAEELKEKVFEDTDSDTRKAKLAESRQRLVTANQSSGENGE